MNKNDDASWEERFDKEFVKSPFAGVTPQHRDGGVTLRRDLKAFIRAEIDRAEQKAFQKGLETFPARDKASINEAIALGRRRAGERWAREMEIVAATAEEQKLNRFAERIRARIKVVLEAASQQKI